MRIALVHDDFIQWGGAERLVQAWAEHWPNAPLFTACHTGFSGPFSWLKNREVHTSFMQNLPLKSRLYRAYAPLYPLAFESFNFRDYDVVLSSSARFAHGIITTPGTVHISYINSPARMLWEPHDYFGMLTHRMMGPLLTNLRIWDYGAAQRADVVIANSENAAKRIRNYHHRDSEVVYPFVELERFTQPSYPKGIERGSFYLVVCRLAAWKRIDMVVEACRERNVPLVVIGSGPDKARLMGLAGQKTTFLSGLTDIEVARYYHACRALIHPQEEDFGITPLEAMACGKPVIAYGYGGVRETVVEGKTGVFYAAQTSAALGDALDFFEGRSWNAPICMKQAHRFSREHFVATIQTIVEQAFACTIR